MTYDDTMTEMNQMEVLDCQFYKYMTLLISVYDNDVKIFDVQESIAYYETDRLLNRYKGVCNNTLHVHKTVDMHAVKTPTQIIGSILFFTNLAIDKEIDNHSWFIFSYERLLSKLDRAIVLHLSSISDEQPHGVES